MQVLLPDLETEAKFKVGSKGRPLTDDEFFEFCQRNPNLRIERQPTGAILIMPAAGLESSYQNYEIAAQLRNWARQDGRGVGFDSSAEFILPSGAAYAPDAAWIRKSRLAKFSKKEKQKFGRICPDFVIELRSPSDRLSSLKAKMEEWMANGVKLGWLIDPVHRAIYVYREEAASEEIRDAVAIEAEGPVKGFRLDLAAVWEGL